MNGPPIDFDSTKHASDVPPVIRTLYGIDLPLDAGVIHPTAVWQAPDDSYLTLKLNSDAPPSRYDRFVLNLARARADALLTTGKILRDEPDLVTDLLGDGPERGALIEWRREFLGRTDPPIILVLTSGHDLDLDHPTFRGWATPVLFTTHSAAQDLFAAALARSVEVVSHDAPTIHMALGYLRDELKCATVSIEAGPTTSRLLYDPAEEVDELLLSVFGGPTLPESVQGPAFLSPATIRTSFGHGSTPYRIDEPSGPWSFQRLTR